eukprot:312889-Pyramimonas_sp.AAC.1
MKQPWTIAYTSNIVTSGPERKCDGAHARVEARGKDCKLAGDCTDEFAGQINVALARAASHSCLDLSPPQHDVCAAAVFSREQGWGRRRPRPPLGGAAA